MPLADLLLQPGGGGGGGGGKRDAKTALPRAAQQQDVCSLIVRVLLRVQQGHPLTLATVKAVWRQLGFSHVFEVGRRHHPAAVAMLPAGILAVHSGPLVPL